MTIAASVTTRAGSLLLAAGTPLDDTAIANLRRRGIDCVTVAVPDPRDAAAVARDTAATRERIAHIFRDTRGEASQALRAVVQSWREAHA